MAAKQNSNREDLRDLINRLREQQKNNQNPQNEEDTKKFLKEFIEQLNNLESKNLKAREKAIQQIKFISDNLVDIKTQFGDQAEMIENLVNESKRSDKTSNSLLKVISNDLRNVLDDRNPLKNLVATLFHHSNPIVNLLFKTVNGLTAYFKNVQERAKMAKQNMQISHIVGNTKDILESIEEQEKLAKKTQDEKDKREKREKEADDLSKRRTETLGSIDQESKLTNKILQFIERIEEEILNEGKKNFNKYIEKIEETYKLESNKLSLLVTNSEIAKTTLDLIILRLDNTNTYLKTILNTIAKATNIFEKLDHDFCLYEDKLRDQIKEFEEQKLVVDNEGFPIGEVQETNKNIERLVEYTKSSAKTFEVIDENISKLSEDSKEYERLAIRLMEKQYNLWENYVDDEKDSKNDNKPRSSVKSKIGEVAKVGLLGTIFGKLFGEGNEGFGLAGGLAIGAFLPKIVKSVVSSILGIFGLPIVKATKFLTMRVALPVFIFGEILDSFNDSLNAPKILDKKYKDTTASDRWGVFLGDIENKIYDAVEYTVNSISKAISHKDIMDKRTVDLRKDFFNFIKFIVDETKKWFDIKYWKSEWDKAETKLLDTIDSLGKMVHDYFVQPFIDFKDAILNKFKEFKQGFEQTFKDLIDAKNEFYEKNIAPKTKPLIDLENQEKSKVEQNKEKAKKLLDEYERKHIQLYGTDSSVPVNNLNQTISNNTIPVNDDLNNFLNQVSVPNINPVDTNQSVLYRNSKLDDILNQLSTQQNMADDLEIKKSKKDNESKSPITINKTMPAMPNTQSIIGLPLATRPMNTSFRFGIATPYDRFYS